MTAMDHLVLLALVLLTAAVLLNLCLTLRLAAKLRALPAEPTPAEPTPVFTLPIGEPLPAISGTRAIDGVQVLPDEMSGRASVLAFLSPGCPKCREARSDLLRVLPAIRAQGVGLWIICADAKHDVAQLLEGSPLMDHVVELALATRRRLNPLNAAPFYIFVDDRQKVQASNFIGDKNWRSFIAQMEEQASLIAP